MNAPRMTIGTLGGMMIPMVEEAAVTAPVNARPNPRLIMGLIRIPPTAAVSDIEVPLIPAKNMLVTTLTAASPPRI